jgi:hypothetical protein
VINMNTSLLHHFFQVAVAQRVGRVPANAQQNDFLRKSHPFHLQHRSPLPLNFSLSA